MGTSRNGGLAFLSRGDIQMIGATTTTDGYQKYFALDDAFRRRFDAVILKEPEKNLLYSILNGFISK